MTKTGLRRDRFDLAAGLAYLNGNSLGPLPAAAPARMDQVMRAEWGKSLIRGWNEHDWMGWPDQLGDRIGRLIGAAPGTVSVGDTLSLKLFQAVSSAHALSGRKVILGDNGNFPSDLYMAAAVPGAELRVVAPEEVAAHLTEEVGVLMLTEVDYRTARRHDMAALTAQAQALGIVTVWDLAHSAGAIPVDLARSNADFAVGCTYKYLNAGPGAPAFFYAAPRHHEAMQNPLPGWLGHAAPFAFEQSYRPAPGVARMRVGTPPVLALAALESALDLWDGLEMRDVYQVACGLLDQLVDGIEARCPDLQMVSPRHADQRGSHVSFAHPEGYAIMQALIARGVIGDFRAPDVIRFGIAPLYNGTRDVAHTLETLTEVMTQRLWDHPDYRKKARVT